MYSKFRQLIYHAVNNIKTYLKKSTKRPINHSSNKGSLNSNKPLNLKLIKSKIREREIYWHICTPKSASTFLGKYLNETFSSDSDYKFVSAVPEYLNRHQYVCVYSLWNRLQHIESNVKIITAHQHALPTTDLLSLLSEKHLVIVQTRGILDTVVSILDHWKRESPSGPWIINLPEYVDKLSDDQKIDLIIMHYVPWHISFIQGWLLAAQSNTNIKIINYESVTTNTSEVLNKFFPNYAGKLKTNHIDGIKAASRFNKGISGRGKMLLSEAQIEQIKILIQKNDHLNQNLLDYL